jgi:hypothetical protein
VGRLTGAHSSSTKRHHRDTTHHPIAEVLEAFGWKVIDTSAVGPLVPGFPDMTIGLGGITDLVQAKTGDKAPYTDAELEFAENWRGRPIVNLPSKQAAIEWATRERHERRRRADTPLLVAAAPRVDGTYRGQTKDGG